MTNRIAKAYGRGMIRSSSVATPTLTTPAVAAKPARPRSYTRKNNHRWLHRGMVRGSGMTLSYEGAEVDRQNDDWIVSATDPTELASSYLSMLQARSRDLARNAPPFIGAIQAIVDAVIDPNDGVRIQPKAFIGNAGDAAGDGVEDLNKPIIRQLKNLWDEISQGMDIDERESAAMQFRNVVREWIEVGESLVVESLDPSPGRSLPVYFKIVPAERLDHSYSRSRGLVNGVRVNRITNGIEFDELGKRVAYHFFTVDDDGAITQEREQVPAGLVHHIFHRLRTGQERGLPWLYGATLLCHDLDDLIGDELTSAHVATMLTGFIKRETPGLFGDDQERTEDNDRPVARFEAGAIMDLGIKEDVQINKPDRPGNNFIPFANFILRCIGKTLGISYERLTGDYSKVNFASGRLAHLVERETIRRIQADLVQLLVRPIWKSFVRYAIALGKVAGATISEFLKSPRNYTKARYITKGVDYQDVLKEVTADGIEIALGLSNLEIVGDRRGRDWLEVLDQRDIELKALAQRGIPLVTIGGASAMTGQGVSGVEETDDVIPETEDDDEPTNARAGAKRSRPRKLQTFTVDLASLVQMIQASAAEHSNGNGVNA